MFNRNNSSPRSMVQGNWKCSDCGAEITELPFEPSNGSPVFCRNCWSKNRQTKKSSFGSTSMVQGNWKCSECGAEITEMPFEPSSDRPIYCRDCWSKKKPARQTRY